MNRAGILARFWRCVYIVVLAYFISPIQSIAALRWQAPKRHTITVRLLVQLPSATTTTAGRNFDTFVAEEELPHGMHKLVRLSYEYLYYEPPLAQHPLGDQVTYKVRASRDETCDESLAAIGQELGLSQHSVQQTLGHLSSQAMLACYRTTPEDLLSIRRSNHE